VLITHLNEGDIALDVGAHCGAYSIPMAGQCGQTGQVVAFEPDQYARELLARNLGLNLGIKRPTVEVCACSDEIDKAILFYSAGEAIRNPRSRDPQWSFRPRTTRKKFGYLLLLSIFI
jgi:FkbM family methyltransferase